MFLEQNINHNEVNQQKVKFEKSIKKSGIKEDVIYDLFDRGFTNGQVKNIVIVKILSGEEITDVADTYSDTSKNLDLLLNSYQISKSDFSSKKSEMFD